MFFKRVCRKWIKYRQRLISHTCLTLAVSLRHSFLVLLLIFNGSQKEAYHLCVLIWIQWYSLCKSCRVFRKFLFAVCLSSRSGLIFTGAGPVVQNLKLFGGTTCSLAGSKTIVPLSFQPGKNINPNMTWHILCMYDKKVLNRGLSLVDD